VDAAASGRRSGLQGASPDTGRSPCTKGASKSGRSVSDLKKPSADDDAVRCGPGRRFASLTSPLRAGPSRVVLTPAAGAKGRSNREPTGARKSLVATVTNKTYRRRGEHEASRKNHRVRNAGCNGAFVVTTLVCTNSTSHTRLRTHCASGVPRALFWGVARMGQAPSAQGQ
jgi:hypothetical protein